MASNHARQYLCEDWCSAADCRSQCNTSTHTAITCCESSCRHPEKCSDDECCRDSDCLREPENAAHCEHASFGNGAQALNLDDFSVLLDYDHEDFMPCRWLETDQTCEAFALTKDALSQHIFREHIGPQTQQKCWWDDCTLTVNSQQFTEHLLHNHHPSSYVCLWQGCMHKFPDAEQLAQHMEVMHTPNLSCHWGGCEVARTDPAELTSHVNHEHLNMGLDQAFQYSEPVSLTASSQSSGSYSSTRATSEQDQVQGPSSSAILPPQHNISLMSQQNSLHTCKWITDHSTGSICGACYAHENDLQTHIEKIHTKDLNARGPLGTSAFVCRWHLCKREGKPMQDKRALNKHMRSHAECKSARPLKDFRFDLEVVYTLVCKYCSKQFDDKAKLGNHERSHTKEKPFKCKDCPGKFSSKEALSTSKAIVITITY